MFYSVEEKKLEALFTFKNLDFKKSQTADSFFKTYGSGNTLERVNMPHERFIAYEELLKMLKKDNKEKYLLMHKGTPFYFLGWTAFDLKNYEKAIYYMDMALSEDIKNANNNDWENLPAGKFLILNESHSAKRTVLYLKDKIKKEIDRFNSLNNEKKQISLENFIGNFVKKLLKDKQQRSIITALYAFILEFYDRCDELELRSNQGGSIEPILVHLFKGCLVFESLLKIFYKQNTIGEIFKNNNFKQDFKIDHISTSANQLSDILVNVKNNKITAFETTAKIRNTSGHKLVHDDIFKDKNNYITFYHRIVNAILYVVIIKYTDNIR